MSRKIHCSQSASQNLNEHIFYLGPSLRMLDGTCYHWTRFRQIFIFKKDIIQGSSKLCNWFFRCLISWINYLPHVCWSTSVVIICRHKLKFTLRIFTCLSLRCFVTSDYYQYTVPTYRWKWIIYHICVFLHSIFKRDYDNCRWFDGSWGGGAIYFSQNRFR